MLRSEIEKALGMTRKAIEYYEEKGLVQPVQTENGYRSYSQEDLETLKTISIYRKLGLNISEIADILYAGKSHAYASIRTKKHEMHLAETKQKLLERFVNGEDADIIVEELSVLEREEEILNRLEIAFPGYFGYCIFSAYRSFLHEKLSEEGEQAFHEYISFLAQLPPLDFTSEERMLIEAQTVYVTEENLCEINAAKLKAIEDPQKWFIENKEIIEEYEKYRQSEEYLSHPFVKIHQKLRQYMIENKYYETAIPLLRTFSKSYDAYYRKMLLANEYYLKRAE